MPSSCSIVASIVALLLLVSSTVAGGSTDASCNTTDPFNGNATINLRYLSHFGNVSVGNVTTGGSVDVSFCVPANVTARDGAECGPAFLAEVGATCADSTLFNIVTSPLTVVDNKTSTFGLGSSASMQTATVLLVCQAGLEFVSKGTPARDGLHVTYTFTGDQVCAGYTPPGPEEVMMSKGAIVGTIIGIVAFVVIASALFQWRSRSTPDGDGYEQI